MIYALCIERASREQVDTFLDSLVSSERAVPAQRSQEEWERWGSDPEDLAEMAALMREVGR